MLHVAAIEYEFDGNLWNVDGSGTGANPVRRRVQCTVLDHASRRGSSKSLTAHCCSRWHNVCSIDMGAMARTQLRDEHHIHFGYLIDMDGVIYRGSQVIPGAQRFIADLRERKIPFRFLTNNSQRSRLDVAIKLQRLGFDVEAEHVFTCAMATARFLAQQKPHGTAFVIGESGLATALHECQLAIVDREPDYVVVGEGRTFTFETIEAGLRMIMGGAKLIATNLDPNCPTEHGLRPGCGAIVAMLEAAAGVRAFSVGKPSPYMLRAARKEIGLTTNETIVIGDTMETDILGGTQLGFSTILVLSGGTRAEDVARYSYQPDVIVQSIGDLDHGGVVDRLLAA